MKYNVKNNKKGLLLYSTELQIFPNILNLVFKLIKSENKLSMIFNVFVCKLGVLVVEKKRINFVREFVRYLANTEFV